MTSLFLVSPCLRYNLQHISGRKIIKNQTAFFVGQSNPHWSEVRDPCRDVRTRRRRKNHSSLQVKAR